MLTILIPAVIGILLYLLIPKKWLYDEKNYTYAWLLTLGSFVISAIGFMLLIITESDALGYLGIFLGLGGFGLFIILQLSGGFIETPSRRKNRLKKMKSTEYMTNKLKD